jgi:hypothetical protein
MKKGNNHRNNIWHKKKKEEGTKKVETQKKERKKLFTWPYKIGKICVRMTRLLCLHLVQALYLPPWITTMMMPYYLSIHLSLYILFISLPSLEQSWYLQ